MRSFKDSLILLVIVFSALFLLNTGLMYFCFGINAFNPVNRYSESAGNTVAERVVSNPAGAGNKNETDNSGNGTSSGMSENTDTNSGTVTASDAKGVLSAGTGMFLTAGEVQCLGDLGFQDKLAALAILSQIGSSQSDRIYGMAEDGVTYAEMEEIKTMLENKLSQADMELLYGLLEKSRMLYAQQQKEKGQQAAAH